MIRNKTIIQKPTDASPETKEQLVAQESVILNQGVKKYSPPKFTISFGLALPQKFFKNKLTKITKLNIVLKKIKKTSFDEKL